MNFGLYRAPKDKFRVIIADSSGLDAIDQIVDSAQEVCKVIENIADSIIVVFDELGNQIDAEHFKILRT